MVTIIISNEAQPQTIPCVQANVNLGFPNRVAASASLVRSAARTGRNFRAPKARHVSAQANGLGLGAKSQSGLKGRDRRPV